MKIELEPKRRGGGPDLVQSQLKTSNKFQCRNGLKKRLSASEWEKSCEWLLINSTRNLSIKVDHATLSKLIFPPTLACSKFQPALNSELRQQLKQSELALNDNNAVALSNYGLRPTKNLKACRNTHNLLGSYLGLFFKLFQHYEKNR